MNVEIIPLLIMLFLLAGQWNCPLQDRRKFRHVILLVQKRDFALFDLVEWSEGVPALQKIPFLVTLPSTNPLDCRFPCQFSALFWKSINPQWIQLFLRVKWKLFFLHTLPMSHRQLPQSKADFLCLRMRALAGVYSESAFCYL